MSAVISNSSANANLLESKGSVRVPGRLPVRISDASDRSDAENPNCLEYQCIKVLSAGKNELW